jgi:hypothetical protein
MTPKQFAALAVATVVSAVVAIAVYSSSVQWSSVTESGEPLVAGLPAHAKTISEVEVDQGDKKITLERKGKDWVLAEDDSYVADPKKVDALLAELSKAQLVEAKTSMKDKYPLLGVEDPGTKDAKSVLVRLVDDQGKDVTSVIVGNKRQNTLGVGGSGTYVRKPGVACECRHQRRREAHRLDRSAAFRDPRSGSGASHGGHSGRGAARDRPR